MKKVKIVYIITGLDTGGAQKILLATLKRLNRNIFNPIVVSLYRNNELLKDFSNMGIKVYSLLYANKNNPLIINKIFRLLRIEKPDIVHTHLPHATIWGRIAARLAGVKTIFTTEHNMSIWKKKHLFFYILYRITYRLNTKIIVVSEAIKKLMISEFRVPKQKIEVLHNGIDFVEIDSMQYEPADIRQLSHPIIGTVGRLHRTKGHAFLIESFRTVVKNFPKTNLLIVGDGDQRGFLQGLVKDLQLGSAIHFLGARKDITAILRLIDIFVFPSIEEGLGIALLEACAAGKPCVATNSGGIPEIIEDGKNGFLVPPSNSKSITDKIIQLLADKDLCQKMGNYGKQIVKEKFNIIDKTNILQAIYLKSVKNRTL